MFSRNIFHIQRAIKTANHGLARAKRSKASPETVAYWTSFLSHLRSMEIALDRDKAKNPDLYI